MKRAMAVVLAAGLLVLGACSSDDKKPESVPTASTPTTKPKPVKITEKVDGCVLVNISVVRSITSLEVATAQSSRSDATPGKTGPTRGCFYESDPKDSSHPAANVLFLASEMVSASKARETFDSTMKDDTLTRLEGIGDIAGYTGRTSDSGTEVDAAALRGKIVVIVRCIVADPKVTTADLGKSCAGPMLLRVLTRLK